MPVKTFRNPTSENTAALRTINKRYNRTHE